MHMTDNMSMIFETMDLMHASPATVSRCGMIYVEPVVLSWEPILESWILGLNPIWAANQHKVINELFYWQMNLCLEFIRKECRTTISAGQIHRAVSTMSIFQMLIEDAVMENPKTFDQYLVVWFQAALIVSMVWGAAGTLDLESRQKFDAFYLSIWKGERQESPLPISVTVDPISLPSEDPIHDQYYSFRGKGSWKRFSDAAKSEPILDTESITSTIIPTIDIIKYQNIMSTHIKYQRCFLLYGDTGTGKSLYLKDLLTNKLKEDEYLPNLITFAPRITAAQTQELVLLKLHKKRGNQYAPPMGKRCVIFVDEVNMPAKEIFGAQPPIELLRQFLDHGIWFDLKKPEAITILDTMLVCAMALPGGSRQEIYRRFLRHFNLFNVCKFSRDSFFRIFTNLAFIGLKRNGFTAGVLPIINDIVNATLRVFDTAINYLRPTPLKPHYLFNVRDFVRVITGCTLLRKESADGSRIVFGRLWVHEVLRVFGDRLIDQSDRNWLFLTIKDTVETILKERFDYMFDYLPKIENEITERSLDNLIFSFMDIEAVAEDQRYEEIPSVEEYQQVTSLFLEEYNDTHRDKIDIVLFRYALKHLARICRVLTIPCGNMLLVGTGGSGRQSLTKLSAAIKKYNLCQPEISTIYGMQEWREEIKNVLRNSGGIGKDLVFLLAEEQIRDEAFLDDINSLLNDGEVPNLFTIEERQEIIEMTRLAAQGDKNLDISVLAVLSYFVNRCREKLHLILCLSPIGDAFRIRLRMYPSLVNCCTIDWFEEWPEDALEQVAHRNIADVELAENIKLEAITICKFFHIYAKEMSTKFYEETSRKTYFTTTSFLDLVRMFSNLTTEKRRELALNRERYLSGLDKLEYAAEQISQMRIVLTELKPQLEASAKETTETMKQIETEEASVKRATVLVKRDENIANAQAEVAKQLKTECEADLAEALPALDDAIAALNTLKPADIAEVKTMKSPPEVIKLVMAAVCVMMNVAPIKSEDPITGGKIFDYWTPSKKLLGDIKFLDSLRQYDKDNIPEYIIQEIKKTYMTNKNFEPKVVARASQAAEGLCKWIRAMVLYDEVAKIVAPKKIKLAAAEHDYENTLSFLRERRQMLAELNEKLDILRKNLHETMTKKIHLENEVTTCRNKLIRAEKLISGLGGEKDRWTTIAEKLQILFEALPGDILISCGMIAYLGPFTAIFRIECLEKWRMHVMNSNIPCSQEYNFVEILGSEIKINSWNIFGLPRDAFSIENAIIMDNSNRWSLFIDPQGQTNKWIRNMEKTNELEIVKLIDYNYMDIIERAIQYGKPVLIENVLEQLDAALDPILMRKTYKFGGILYIALGEKSIEYNPNFRLYITTKLRNPHYSPEIFNKITLINSVLTLEALEDQLLGIVVAKEQPDLQEKREYLIIQSALNSKTLKEVEDNILQILSATGVSILEDEKATEILDSSKILSTDIKRKQVAAKKTALQIEEFRQNYRPIAKYSATLYYSIVDLSNINPMYQYSLSWFINLYIVSIDTASKSKNLGRRLDFLRKMFTYNLYQNICRSLFDKNKILYSFILYTTILLASGEIIEKEMSFFISGGFALSEPVAKNPAIDWLPEKSWNEISKISSILPIFTDFTQSFRENLLSWKEYYDILDPIDSFLPQPWETILTPFQKLIVIRMIRPDTVPIMVQRFVENGMGLSFVIAPPFDISKAYADSSCLIPLIFLLSAGSDPMGELMKFAESMNYLERFESISLGQGQGPIAQRMIEQAQTEGSWICLQNCHLAASWMPNLEKICESLDHTNTLSSFRLWLTSYPSDKFPVSILQDSVKMTTEAPMGLQNNIMRSYLIEGAKEMESLEKDPLKKRTFFKLLYALCFFHAVVQERRNYGPQGWNIRYDFNESDLQISAEQLKMFVQNYEQVPFKAITYLTGECNYGGRVTDERDRRCLITILKDFFNPDVIANPNYSFADIGPEYTIPKKHGYEDYVKHIQSIPLNPSPEVFGLNVNASIIRNLELTANLFDSMTLIRSAVIVGDVRKQDEILLNMKKDIYERIPNLFDIEEAQKRYPIMYIESMNTVLVQELERYNDLLTEIRNSLTTLEKAVKGFIVMTPLLEEMANNMLNAKIPLNWINACAYPTLKRLPSFIDDLIKRLGILQNWLDDGKPAMFWISGFSFTHAFLTAIAQNYARKYKIPIDKIDFDFEVISTHQSRETPIDGAYTYGMFLSGARWDFQRMLLAESYPKILWDPMPIVWIKPCEVALIFIGDRYECPLYITSARFGVLKTTGHSSNYILSIFIDTDYPVSHWIKRGLALLCQLDD